eukprot:scaffold259048_cov17-Tisochrysis_lutea.AAC.1
MPDLPTPPSTAALPLASEAAAPLLVPVLLQGAALATTPVLPPKLSTTALSCFSSAKQLGFVSEACWPWTGDAGCAAAPAGAEGPWDETCWRRRSRVRHVGGAMAGRGQR